MAATKLHLETMFPHDSLGNPAPYGTELKFPSVDPNFQEDFVCPLKELLIESHHFGKPSRFHPRPEQMFT